MGYHVNFDLFPRSAREVNPNIMIVQLILHEVSPLADKLFSEINLEVAEAKRSKRI